MQKQPNIFKYATSELSQDAFIAWLLSWSDSNYKNEDEQMHQLGLDFLESLLAKHQVKLNKIRDLEIKTQYYKIDVFVSFVMDNKKHGLIIEDKVFSSNHSNQLIKYKSLIDNQNYDVVIPIYFKTGFQHCYKDVIDKNYHPFTVKDFISVLRKGISQGVENSIFLNYYNYIIRSEKLFDEAEFSYQNYNSISISQWDWWSYSGFFNDIKDKLNGSWGSVGNKREPLLAFWCEGAPFKINDFDTGQELYLNIYLDVKYTGGGIDINFRLGNLNKFPQTNSQNRNNIYNKFEVDLNANNIKHRKPHFRKSKGTLCLAQITGIDTSINHLDLWKLLEKYKNVSDQFAKSLVVN